MKAKLEYIWLDGFQPTQSLRSKTQVRDNFGGTLEECPMWSFDGSSTEQADGSSSDCLLKPVAIFPDPGRQNGFLVMTEVLNASLHLVNAYPAAPINVAVEIPEFDVTQYSDELEKHHKNAMANFARKYRIPNAQQHVEQGLPEQVIPDLAKRLDAELVVLVTKGRTGFSAALLGNTAEHVLERLNCDVLAIKPADFKSPVA